MPLLLLMILVMPFETNPYLKIADNFLIFPDFTVIKALGMLAFAYVALKLATGDTGGVRLIDSPQAKYFVVFFCCVLFAGVLSGSGFVPISRYLAFLMFMPVVLVSVRTHEDLRKVVYGMVIAYLIVFPYAVRQMLRYGTRLGEGVYETNYFAADLVLVTPIAFGIAAAQVTRAKRFMWAGAGLTLAIAVLLTASRGGFLGLAAAASAYVYRRRGLAATALMLLMLIAAALILPTGLAERTLYTLGFDVEQPDGMWESNKAHVGLLWAGLRMVADAPFTGVGPENFKVLSRHYGSSLIWDYTAHNTYLELAAEMGLPVLTIFLCMVGTALITLGRATRLAGRDPEEREMASWAEGLRAGLLGFSLSASFISGQYEKVFWVVVFLSIVVHRRLEARARARVRDEVPPVGVRGGAEVVRA